MKKSDEVAIELAAERRRHEEAEQAELDARRAELPRVMRDARHEPRNLWRKLVRGFLRAVSR